MRHIRMIDLPNMAHYPLPTILPNMAHAPYSDDKIKFTEYGALTPHRFNHTPLDADRILKDTTTENFQFHTHP